MMTWVFEIHKKLKKSKIQNFIEFKGSLGKVMSQKI